MTSFRKSVNATFTAITALNVAFTDLAACHLDLR